MNDPSNIPPITFTQTTQHTCSVRNGQEGFYNVGLWHAIVYLEGGLVARRSPGRPIPNTPYSCVSLLPISIDEHSLREYAKVTIESDPNFQRFGMESLLWSWACERALDFAGPNIPWERFDLACRLIATYEPKYGKAGWRVDPTPQTLGELQLVDGAVQLADAIAQACTKLHRAMTTYDTTSAYEVRASDALSQILRSTGENGQNFATLIAKDNNLPIGLQLLADSFAEENLFILGNYIENNI